jgi:hypothetical protein
MKMFKQKKIIQKRVSSLFFNFGYNAYAGVEKKLFREFNFEIYFFSIRFDNTHTHTMMVENLCKHTQARI